MTRTIEERLAAVEKTQDDVVNLQKTVAGQLKRIINAKGGSLEQKIDALIELIIIIAGQMESIKPRGR